MRPLGNKRLQKFVGAHALAGGGFAQIFVATVIGQKVVCHRPIPLVRLNTHPHRVAVFQLGRVLHIKVVDFNDLQREPKIVLPVAHLAHQHRPIASHAAQHKALHIEPRLPAGHGAI